MRFVCLSGYCGAGIAELDRLAVMGSDPSGGVDPIAAIIVDTVQGEGGLNVASYGWLRALSDTARRLGALLIVDDIQAGCGRTGTFFSFERAGIVPDIVCLAKSYQRAWSPMSLLLIRAEHDVWSPGEHNGTFRGNALAFATATAGIRLWEQGEMDGLERNGTILADWCGELADEIAGALRPKGIGMMRGLEFRDPAAAQRAASGAFGKGMIVECCGPQDEVLKIMASLNIGSELFREGLARVSEAVGEALARGSSRSEDPQSPFAMPGSERDEVPLDPYDNRRDAVAGAELAHSVA